MSFIRTCVAAPALVVLLSGTAHAALTADQIWQSWKDGAAMAGLKLSAATELNEDGTLTLNGVTLAPEGAKAPLTISDLVLTEQDDGTVLIEPGAAIGLTSTEGDSASNLKIAHEGLTLTASEGDEGGIVYDYSADSLNVSFDSTAPGYSFTDQPAKPTTAKGTFTFEALEGSYSDTPGDNRVFGLDLAASKMAYDIASDDPNMPMKTAQKTEAADVDLSADFTLPTSPLSSLQSPADFGRALQEGLAFTLSMTQGASTGSAVQEDQFFPYNLTSSSLPGSAELVLNKDTFHLTAAGEGGEMEMTSAAIPAPLKLAFGAVAMTLTSPVVATEAAGDYAYKLGVASLTLNDEAWGLFDPEAKLKHDPATIDIDISGKTKIDWPAIMAAETGGMTEAPPVPAPETLDIAKLAVTVAGAALDATGAFTFDNAMGVPMPVGTADVSVSGANQLIDGLVAIGVITEDDAMGARMMMGAFMTPGSAPDTLTSKIEAKEGGAIFVNGQQIQ